MNVDAISVRANSFSKRRLALYGKEGAEAALRCADKAIEIAGEGFWDSDEIEIEVSDDICMPSFCCSSRDMVAGTSRMATAAEEDCIGGAT